MSGLAKIDNRDVTEPLRVVIVGHSASLMVIPDHRLRSDGNYGEVLEGLLKDSDIEAVVDHQGRWFELIHDMRPRYESSIRNRFPDVLVINYGIAECQPHVVPTRLIRFMTTWNRSSHPVALAWRSRLAPRIWRPLREFQRSAAAKVGTHTWRLSPKRFAVELTRLVTMTREEVGCLVLVLDADPPGPRVEHWLPGMTVRWRIIQRVIADVVRDIDDPQVRLVEASKTIENIDEDLPDSFHRSPAAHRRTADLLHTEIVKWLDEA